MTGYACLLRERGGPNGIHYEAVTVPPPGAGQVQIRHMAIGVNFIDVLMCRGSGVVEPPVGLGFEAVGVIAAVGEGVTNFRVGDRVGTINAGPGSYSTARNVASEKLIRIPAAVSDEQAAAVLFKGLTAQYLVQKTYPIQSGDIVVVHAAAGGVGSIICRWAKHLGAFVIGVVGSAAKKPLALQAGCDVAIDLSSEDLAEQVKSITDGRKARVVFDSVGRATFQGSIDSLAPFGLLVIYGGASGPAPAVDPELLNQKGGLYLTRPSVFTHNARAEDLEKNAAALFAAVAAGAVHPVIGGRFALRDAASAHRAVEARTTHGSVILIP